MESVRQASLLELLLSAKVHVLCTGETGTGKSVSVTAALASLAAKGPTLPICLNFSAQTSANATQVILETLILFSRWRRMEKDGEFRMILDGAHGDGRLKRVCWTGGLLI